ncbi:hypothetical protein P7D22_07910 [Lichenihabitans sp. Uapishka_5]|uniref:hypothetical protein n=1 Tax=Lichenihabitans sp. Uapishka_5 TaxID=3037302 RepID=UPI0029E7FEFE|nr:hypothetical protein [Lichenihabitans sp. Uapishka_5]MDX7951104.1 hypothetical protein [Lichenihabitans sp. Uapishka_5]
MFSAATSRSGPCYFDDVAVVTMLREMVLSPAPETPFGVSFRPTGPVSVIAAPPHAQRHMPFNVAERPVVSVSVERKLVTLRKRLVEAQRGLLLVAAEAEAMPTYSALRQIADLESAIVATETMIEEQRDPAS